LKRAKNYEELKDSKHIEKKKNSIWFRITNSLLEWFWISNVWIYYLFIFLE
jgi:hypothetical protein